MVVQGHPNYRSNISQLTFLRMPCRRTLPNPASIHTICAILCGVEQANPIHGRCWTNLFPSLHFLICYHSLVQFYFTVIPVYFMSYSVMYVNTAPRYSPRFFPSICSLSHQLLHSLNSKPNPSATPTNNRTDTHTHTHFTLSHPPPSSLPGERKSASVRACWTTRRCFFPALKRKEKKRDT